MSTLDILSALSKLVLTGDLQQAHAAPKAWLSITGGEHFFVAEFDKFTVALELLYMNDSMISERFTRATFYKAIEDFIIDAKKSHIIIDQEKADNVILSFKNITPQEYKVIAPVSGIRLEYGVSNFNIGPFSFGPIQDLLIPISLNTGMYVGIYTKNIYDKERAIEAASTSFADFARLMHFMLGRFDNKHLIKFGLPVLPDMGPEKMYAETTSFGLIDKDGHFDSASMKSKYVERIPVNNPHFCSHPQLNQLWTLYKKMYEGQNITKMQTRILNAALAIGESARSVDKRNSLLYSCIAIETLISYDEGSLYQKSIGDKLAETLAYIVGKDKESRLSVIKMVKDVYGMRSGIVHGGKKYVSDQYIEMNILVRAAISALINDNKYQSIKTISNLYDMVREAQASYS